MVRRGIVVPDYEEVVEEEGDQKTETGETQKGPITPKETPAGPP
jgi:hypothetical protein